MKNNIFGGILWQDKDRVEEIYSNFELAAPCYYQYYSHKQKA